MHILVTVYVVDFSLSMTCRDAFGVSEHMLLLSHKSDKLSKLCIVRINIVLDGLTRRVFEAESN